MEDIITRNIQTFTTPIHDTTLQVFDPGASVGVTMYLEGHGVRWSNGGMSWLEWDQMVAWVEWRRRDMAARLGRAEAEALLREDRVLPIVADNLREILQNHLRQEAQDDVWLARIRQNVRAQVHPSSIFESLGTERELTVDAVAALLKETHAFTRKVIEVLAAETPQFVALRGEELVIPFSGLQWIIGEGREKTAGSRNAPVE